MIKMVAFSFAIRSAIRALYLSMFSLLVVILSPGYPASPISPPTIAVRSVVKRWLAVTLASSFATSVDRVAKCVKISSPKPYPAVTKSELSAVRIPPKSVAKQSVKGR